MKHKQIKDGFIAAIGKNIGGTQIDDAEYNAILDIIRSAPAAPDGYACKLRADTLEWELVELPPAPEPSEEDISDEEALNIILGGGDA